MPDIFDEVAEDLRTERMRRLAMRYGGFVIAAFFLVLIGIGGWKGWQWYQHKQNLHAASQYLAITQKIENTGSGLSKSARIKDAKSLEAFAAKAPSGYAALARLRAASLYAKAGDDQAAQKAWSAVAAKGNGADPLLRGLAQLLAAQQQMGHAPNAKVLAQLKPLMADSSPWQPLAQFDAALLDMQAGKKDAAKSLFQRVASDPKTPAHIRNLAQGLVSQLGG